MTRHLAHPDAADPPHRRHLGGGPWSGLGWGGPSGPRWAAWLVFAPLLLSAAPRSFLAHDEGYYALQARWISEGGPWLAPLWWGQPVFDRTIGVQWLIAGAYRLLGVHAWVAHLPSLVAAVACLGLTAALARQLGVGPLPAASPFGSGAAQSAAGAGLADPAPLSAAPGASSAGWLSALLLALTPLWINYAHLASQDLPLLALELLGLYALVRARPGASPLWGLVAGLSVGPAFLIKGFMVAVPLVAIAPFLWLQRRRLLARPALWLGLGLGWLPVLAWLGLSLREFGPEVVGGLVSKLLYLSHSDVYSGGPFYYIWNIPANTAPWALLALVGWWRLGSALGRDRFGEQGREQRLVLLLYPLLLLLLLSAFRTKTPYYGLQLTPMLAIVAAQVLQRWSQAGRARPRGLAWGLAGFGGLLALAGLGLLWPGAPLAAALQLDPAQLPGGFLAYGLAALALGGSWLLIPFGRRPRALLTAALLGPWLALVLLVQAGLFSDRSPVLRAALAQPEIVNALSQGPVAVVAPEPLSGEAHAQLILLALASPQLGPRLPSLEALPAGGLAWVQGVQAARDRAPKLEVVASGETLGDWALVRTRP
ncbi:MAG: glycosyltransferase family 39 protein [Cyanobacteria bacterium]|nr:glycosyltransferase family 39 protein [Cyanobacteriota bacterium]